MAGNVDDVVNAAEDPVVAILRLHRAVARHVRPVAPVLAFRILAVARIVLPHEASRVLPDGLKAAGPRIAYADVAGLPRSGRQLLALVVVDDRMDAGDPGTRTAGFHLVDCGDRAAKKPAVLGLPPGIHDHRLALADHLVVPLPDRRFDGLAHRGHVFEAIVVLRRLVGTVAAQGADRRRRRVEDVDAKLLGDAPGPSGVGVGGYALVDNRRGRERKRAVDDVGVARDPADVCQTPIDVLEVDVLDVLRRPRHVRKVAADGMLATFRLARGAAGVHAQQRRLSPKLHGLHALAAILLQEIIDDDVASFHQRSRARVL